MSKRKIQVKWLAVLLVMATLLTTVNMSAFPVSADNLTEEELAELGGWDYGFQANFNGATVGYLDEAFDVYQYKKPVNTEAAKAEEGPVRPSAVNPDAYKSPEGIKYSYFTTLHYGDTGAYGLKPTTIVDGDGQGYTVLTYKKESMTDFEAEYEFYNGNARAFGLAFGGEPGVFPLTLDNDNANDTGVAMFMEGSGNLYVYGAINSSQTETTGGVIYSTITEAEYPVYETVVGTGNIRTSSMFGTDTAPAVPEEVNADTPSITICVKVKDGKLTVYEKGQSDLSVTVSLSDQYQGGYVSLIANATDQGAFGSFRIKRTDEWDYEAQIKPYSPVNVFDNDFEVYQFGRPTDAEHARSIVGPKKLSDIDVNAEYENTSYSYFTANWFGQTGNGGLKPTYIQEGNGAGGYTVMTYNRETMTNFKAEFEVYGGYGTPVGMVFGSTEKTVFPITCNGNSADDTGVAIYMENDGGIFVYGAIDSTTIEIAGAAEADPVSVNGSVAGADYRNYVSSTTALKLTEMTDGAKMDITNSEVSDDTATLTVCVEVQDGVLTVYEKNHSANKVSIGLTDMYEGGYVSFFGTHAQHYSFKSFRIKKNADPVKEPETYMFDNSMKYPDDYNAAFKSYKFSSDGAVTEGTAGELWTTEQVPGDLEIEGYYRNWRLKPKHKNDGSMTLLTLKDQQVRNFEASVQYLIHWTEYGFIIAPEGKQATSQNGIKVDVDSEGRIRVNGAIDAPTAVWNGNGNGIVDVRNSHSVWGPSLKENGYEYKAPSTDATNNKTEYTLRVKVQDGVLTAWIKEFENAGKLTVNLTANYAGGSISLYSTGCNQGGFHSFSFLELADTPAEPATVTAQWEQLANGVAVTLSADQAYSKLSGTIGFDNSKYTYAGERLYPGTMTENEEGRVTAEGNTLTFTVTGNEPGKFATYLFESTGSDKNDFGRFTLTPEISGVAAAKFYMAEAETVRGDVTGDNCVDVRDLVRLKLYAEDSASVTIDQANSDLLGGGNYTDDENFTQLRKSLLGIGTVQFGTLNGKTGLFLGDSIAYGANDGVPGTSWGGRLEDYYGMDNEVVAVSGSTLASTWQGNTSESGDRRVVIVDQLDNAQKDTYDYVILHGGVNDVWAGYGKLGELTSAENTTGFDTGTWYGALEDLICKTRDKYPTAKIGYIINFDINVDKQGSMEDLVTAVKKVCEKYGVPYLDLYSHSKTALQDFAANNAYVGDGVHPNAAGYDILTPIIADWMKTL